MTAGKMNGSLLRVASGGTLLAHATNCSIDFGMNTRDTTTKDNDGYQENAAGLRTVNISTEHLYAEDAAYGVRDLFTAYKARTPLTLRFTAGDIGDKYWEGPFLLTQLTLNGPQEDNASYSASFVLAGTLTDGDVT